MTRLLVITALLCLAIFPSTAHACAIPVFRYALERWAADLYEVDVFTRGEFTPEQRKQLSAIEDLSLVNGGQVNLEVVRCRVEGRLAPDLATVWESLGEVELPYIVLRAPGGRQGSPRVWQGALAEFAGTLADSPVRQQLTKRLLAGDSVVWLVLPGTDREQAQAVTARLQQQFAPLADEIAIPNGVGQPGSELRTAIPLGVKFSVLTAAGNEERALYTQVVAHIREDVSVTETLVVPVFGRGRALQVLQADDIDEDTIAEVSRFLCGACSCQVKQQNPGFDLLLAINWDERLFAPGEAASTEPPAEEPAVPELVAIASGAATDTTSTVRKEMTGQENPEAPLTPADFDPNLPTPSTIGYANIAKLIAVAAVVLLACTAIGSRLKTSSLRMRFAPSVTVDHLEKPS